ncbi:MlaE family lipid ABC transporter permease subunit [Desulfatitalea alkaliphila]|uniref:MlaE family lipid ABC transporter permease subunit n=1 Tax=Desulfatitalea alkaliphila TaxID=2929485 RepID=A0AA41R6C0_9BACT|nr:MlaE family lipid ABC transporter permease subunit [Desulfatitalea alkaliphila]MCJ8501970.1 MlaE family lipid ABC transporter permease subunit [Desulfatitalea alkaliphila]
MSESYALKTGDNGTVAIQLIGRIDHHGAARLLKQLQGEVKQREPKQVTVDLNRVTFFDDFGLLVLFQLRDHLNKQEVPFRLVQPPPKVAEILARTSFDDPDMCSPLPHAHRDNTVVRLGAATIQFYNSLNFVISFLGSVILAMLHVIRHPRDLRVGDTIVLMQKVGVDALPIVAMISFLLGLIMAFVSSMQLEQFGASIFVARLVALAMVSELGPIMTAIVVAGRSGSAFAAEIGTMRISDEIDALFTMGFSPTLFLAVPRILAAMIMVPLLTLFSDIFAIAGGMVISVSMMNLTVATYIDQTLKALTLFELMWGLMKSVVFAALIAWVGCLRGFQVRGGSSEVGNAATSAVVSGIFLIILFDSIFAVIRSYW